MVIDGVVCPPGLHKYVEPLGAPVAVSVIPPGKHTSVPVFVMFKINLGYTMIPVNGIAFPHDVVAFNVIGPHGPAPVLPCHRIVILLVPCPSVIVPWLVNGAAILHVTISPGGNVPPVNV